MLTSSIEVWGTGAYEGDSGSTFLEFQVNLTQPISAPLDVAYETFNSTDPWENPAIAGSDYVFKTGTLQFTPGGETSQIVAVEIIGDRFWEWDEWFGLTFTPSDGSGSTFATGVIGNDDMFPELAVSDAEVVEGHYPEFSELVFTITRTGDSEVPLDVAYWTTDGTATEYSDYEPTWGWVTFDPGESNETISVLVYGDREYEANETVLLNVDVLDYSLVTVTDNQGVGTILNDDPAGPVVEIVDFYKSEGNEGQIHHSLTLTLDQPVDEWIELHLSTSDGTATAGFDYLPLDQSVYFAPGETVKDVDFVILGDRVIEDNEFFNISVRGVTGAELATNIGWIFNDDHNTGPNADAGGPYSVPEGGEVTLEATGTWDAEQPAETLFYEWDLDFNGYTFDADVTGYRAVFSAAGLDGPAARTIAVRVTDDYGVWGFDTAPLDILNAPPSADAGGDQSAVEGSTVTVAGTATDPGPDALSYHWRLLSSTNGQAIADQSTASFDFVPADNGIYTFELTVTDDDGASNTDTVVVTVENRVPTATVTGDAIGYAGQTLSFQLGAGDPSAVDQAAGFTYEINWGDGSPPQSVAGGTTLGPIHHRFANPGQYVVSVTSIDKDGGRSSAATHQVDVVHALIQDGNLYVGGSDGNDFIWINPETTSGSVSVNVNGAAQGTFAPSGRIIVYGGAGNDAVALHPDLTIDAWLFGESGDDVLVSARGNDVLSGGAGADWLSADRGRDLLFGGAGADSLDGGNDEDILISGSSSYDTDEIALAAIMAEWTSPRDFTTRQRNLRDGSGSADRLNDQYFLVIGETVFDDGEEDSISGGGGRNWTL